VGKPSLYAAQPYAKAEGRVFLRVPAYPGCPGTKAVKRLLLLYQNLALLKRFVTGVTLVYPVDITLVFWIVTERKYLLKRHCTTVKKSKKEELCKTKNALASFSSLTLLVRLSGL